MGGIRCNEIFVVGSIFYSHVQNIKKREQPTVKTITRLLLVTLQNAVR